MDRLMQICADDGVIAYSAGIALSQNPFSHVKFLGYAWETGWKEAEFVAQNRAR